MSDPRLEDGPDDDELAGGVSVSNDWKAEVGALVAREIAAQGGQRGEVRLRWRSDGGAIVVETRLDSKRPPAGTQRPEFLLVEDDELSARAMARLIRRHGDVRIAGSLAEAREMLGDPANWAGMLVDVTLPDGNGLDFVEEVRARDARVPILVLTGGFDPRRTNRAQTLDAEFAFKPLDVDNLVPFAERACAAFRVDDRAVAAVIARRARESGLTPREMDVLGLVIASEGSPRMNTAEALGVSANTAKVHIGSILRKTGSQKLADLVQSILREAWMATRPE
ncbi:MAG: response regulator [Sandaracinaceae bacterium]